MQQTERPEPLGRWYSRVSAALSPLASPRLRLPLIAAMLSVGVVLHYGDVLPLLSDASAHSPVGLATRQALERILFLLPVIYAASVLGARAGAVTLAVAGAVLLPRALTSYHTVDHAFPEIGGVLVVGSLLILAITQQRREIEAQKAMRHNLHYFLRQMLRAQEDERLRIALELHDETAQALLLTCQRLDRLASGDGCRLPSEVAGELQDLRASTVQTLTDLRRLTQHLRPRILDDHGLAPALEWLADYVADQYSIEVQVRVSAALPEHSPETQLLLFRIAQEALRNVGRHSGATEAAVSLDGHEDWIRMTVADNGRGFALTGGLSDLASKGKLGLLGMDERARLGGGTLAVRSAPGKGTIIVAELPGSAASRLSAAESFDRPYATFTCT